jgi:hypothetical protein
MRREEDRGLKKEVLEIEKEMKKLATVWPDPQKQKTGKHNDQDNRGQGMPTK